MLINKKYPYHINFSLIDDYWILLLLKGYTYEGTFPSDPLRFDSFIPPSIEYIEIRKSLKGFVSMVY